MNNNMPSENNKAILDFWNQRAELGILAGTNDFMLTEIEQKFIVETIPEKSHILDIGCGNAMSLIKLAQDKKCTGVGIDFSEGMVAQSKKFVSELGLSEKIKIYQNSVPPAPTDYGKFDVVMSNRALINLQTTEDQRKSVQSIPQILRPGGMYLMIECSWDGGERTNDLRKQLGLEPISPPWHNLFFKEADVKSWQSPDFKIEQFLHISSTYHFLSRVVNAKYAEMNGEELKYDSDINKIAAMLPPQIGDFGPVKAWVWRKTS
jgi:SAM-dependent methyltransferase